MGHDRRPFQTLVVALGLAAALAVAAGRSLAAPSPVTVYVGTYTDAGSRGIYRLTLDPVTGAVSEPVLAAEAKNPSFLALDPSGRLLYSVGEVDRFEGKKSGAVDAFAVDPKTGELKAVNQQPSEGTGPCHLTVDGKGRNVLVANYGSGTVAVLPIAKDGALRPASSVRTHQGSGPNRARQASPHAHGVYLDRGQRFALVADLGADRIFVYRYDAAKGALEPRGSTPLPPGVGPRHLAFDRSGRHVYAADEMASTVTVLDYDPSVGTLLPVQTASTLPAGYKKPNTAAEIAVSPDGRHLYASNRGHDSLAVFAVDPDSGRLTPAGHVPSGGRTPRHFAIDPSGRWLLAAHQDSGSIVVFRLDPATGLPSPAGTQVSLSKPVCVLFAGGR